ncbi:hypothetical protein Syun_015012 [Stephania yunnanensis]|uniref:Bromo domain-containing protein n=1 Tax=Stephania yunnanensis TaxID=152371 RepID=A0AAP0P9B2_9MAGN
MGKIVEGKKKKKKGRPSLLDLQKRKIREQQELQQQQQQQQQQRNQNQKKHKPNPNPSPNPTRRSTRRNPNPDAIQPNDEQEEDEDAEDDEDDGHGGAESSAKRREKKLKLVLRFPPHQQRSASSLNSNSEDENGEGPVKRRKINVVGDRSGFGDAGDEGEKQNSTSKTIDSQLGKPMEIGPTTPLPDKKLLVFILDRLQKKDTYGVFSDPVDPDELPDYHDIIEHPMDFSTVRNKLSNGAYACLEQFENDVFLICSNAMTYNSSDTVYFRQARAIKELAKKNFENLRQDSDDNETSDKEPKIVRRGRPPTKSQKKPIGRPPLDRASSEFSSDATLANADANIWSNSYDLRKSFFLEKSGSADLSGRNFNGFRNSEERKAERNDEFPASVSRNFSTKLGKKHMTVEDNRRDTYKQFLVSVGSEQSVLNTFDGHKKQLVAVGLHTDHGFARSLARFAADLGPVVWKIASKKIERALPPQVMFGPGWVGEKDKPVSRSAIPTPSSAQSSISEQHISRPQIPSPAVPCMGDLKGDKSSEKQEPSSNSISDVHSDRTAPASTLVPCSARKSPELSSECRETSKQPNGESGSSASKSHPAVGKPTHPLQTHQRQSLNSGMNGFHSAFAFDLASQMAKFVRPALPGGGFGAEASLRPQMLGVVSRSNNSNSIHPNSKPVPAPGPANHLDSEHRKLSEGKNAANSDASIVDSAHQVQVGAEPAVQPESSVRESSVQTQKIDSVPPDLNVRFQSPGSPSCSQQPDLALQL